MSYDHKFKLPINTLTKSVHFYVADSADDMLKAFAVRVLVFCGEQGVAYSLEHDEHDLRAVHIVGELEGEPVAAARLRFFGEYAKLERIAVRKAYRGHNIGHQLTDFLVVVAQQRGFHKYKMHAQASLEKFYQQHQFVTQGDRFEEVGVEHCLMVRDDLR